MSGSDMKGTWARKGYTFQFTRDTEWEGNAVPTIQYRSPFTKKSDHYKFEQVFFSTIPQRLKWKVYFVPNRGFETRFTVTGQMELTQKVLNIKLMAGRIH